MSIISNTVNYLDGDVALEGFFAYDDNISVRRPAVLISHAWGGRDEFVMEKAKKIAELGYFAFALDMYGHGKTGKTLEENRLLMLPFMANRALLQKRMIVALSAIKLFPWVDDKKIAAIGFCFGGLCVLDLARTGVDIKGVVSFHGLFNAPDNLQNIKINAKILVLHGHDDPMLSAQDVINLEQELTAAGADWQLHSYGNTMHAFTNPLANDSAFGTVYQATSDKRSWQSMINFFNEIFV